MDCELLDLDAALCLIGGGVGALVSIGLWRGADIARTVRSSSDVKDGDALLRPRGTVQYQQHDVIQHFGCFHFACLQRYGQIVIYILYMSED